MVDNFFSETDPFRMSNKHTVVRTYGNYATAQRYFGNSPSIYNEMGQTVSEEVPLYGSFSLYANQDSESDYFIFSSLNYYFNSE
jgi:hypothetical protein